MCSVSSVGQNSDSIARECRAQGVRACEPNGHRDAPIHLGFKSADAHASRRPTSETGRCIQRCARAVLAVDPLGAVIGNGSYGRKKAQRAQKTEGPIFATSAPFADPLRNARNPNRSRRRRCRGKCRSRACRATLRLRGSSPPPRRLRAANRGCGGSIRGADTRGSCANR